jgi:hypothetical protein
VGVGVKGRLGDGCAKRVRQLCVLHINDAIALASGCIHSNMRMEMPIMHARDRNQRCAMSENELKQCLFCGATGPNVCAGLYPEPGCAKPGLAERISAHQSKRAPTQGDAPFSIFRPCEDNSLNAAQRIVFTCDFLRTDERGGFNEGPNIKRVHDLIAPAIRAATDLPVLLFPEIEGDAHRITLDKIYGYFGLTPSSDNWAKLYHGSITVRYADSEALLLDFLRPAFEGAIVVSFEASPLLQRLISKLAVAVIDIRAHSYRFLLDFPFAFHTNSARMQDVLSKYCIPSEAVTQRVEELRNLSGGSLSVPSKSVVFFAQTALDSSVIKADGTFFDVTPHLKSLVELVNSYGASTLLVKPHPLEPENEVVKALMSLPIAKLTHESSYKLMQTENVAGFVTYSSSTGHEAIRFGKQVTWLSATRVIEKYIPIMFEYRTSRFWKDLLSPAAKHKRHPEHEPDVKFQPNFLRERFGIPWDAALMLSAHGVFPALTDHQGFVDEVTPSGIRGWAVDLQHAERPVDLEIMTGKEVIARGRTGLPREDVAAAGYPNAATGFFVALPENLTSSQFTVRIAGSGELLHNGWHEGF